MSLSTSHVKPPAKEPVIDSPTPPKPITKAPRSNYNPRFTPAPRIYQDYLLLEVSNKPALANFMMNKTA